MDEQRLREALERVGNSQKVHLQSVLAEEAAIEQSDKEVSDKIKALERTMNTLRTKKSSVGKKLDRLRSINGRLRGDLETILNDLSSLHQSSAMGAVEIKREIDFAQTNLRELKSTNSEMEGNLDAINQKILITQNVVAELEAEHKVTVDATLDSTLTVYQAFQRWLHLWPAVSLSLAADADSIKTINSTAKVAGRLEEIASLRYLCEEIQNFSNSDFETMEQTSHHPNYYFWDDLLSKLRKHADVAVAKASATVTEIEEIERTRQRLRDIGHELCNALNADVNISMYDAELSASTLGKESEVYEPTIIIPVMESSTVGIAGVHSNTKSTKHSIAGPGTGMIHSSVGNDDVDGTILNDKRRQALMDRALAMAQIQAQQKRTQQDKMRKQLSAWIDSLSLPVGDLSMAWCTQVLTATDPMKVWSLAKEFPSKGTSGRYYSTQFQPLGSDGLRLAGYGDEAINSINLCRVAAEYRRIVRELQLSFASLPVTTGHKHVRHNNNNNSIDRKQEGIVTNSVEIEPRYPAVFKDWIHYDSILQYTGQKYNCSPVEVIQKIYNQLDSMLGVEPGEQDNNNDITLSAPESVEVGRNQNQYRNERGHLSPRQHIESDQSVGGDDENEDEDEDAFDASSKGLLQVHKPTEKMAKTTRFAINNNSGTTSSYSNAQEGSNQTSRSDGNSRGQRYTISQRMNDKFSAVLKLFPSETTSAGTVADSADEVGGTVETVASHRDNVLLMVHEKEELEKEDLGERIILHLTCRVSGDLLNICIFWQPHLERLKFVAHCLQLSGKEIYQFVVYKHDIDAIFADSNDSVLRNMKLDNANLCKALVSCARIEHFPPGIAFTLVRKSRGTLTKAQLKSVPIVETSLFVDTMKLLTLRSASGALITCCLESNVRFKSH